MPRLLPVVEAVLVPGSIYWRPNGSTWRVVPEAEPDSCYSPLGGFALTTSSS